MDGFQRKPCVHGVLLVLLLVLRHSSSFRMQEHQVVRRSYWHDLRTGHVSDTKYQENCGCRMLFPRLICRRTIKSFHSLMCLTKDIGCGLQHGEMESSWHFNQLLPRVTEGFVENRLSLLLILHPTDQEMNVLYDWQRCCLDIWNGVYQIVKALKDLIRHAWPGVFKWTSCLRKHCKEHQLFLWQIISRTNFDCSSSSATIVNCRSSTKKCPYENKKNQVFPPNHCQIFVCGVSGDEW